MVNGEVSLLISSEYDIVTAREKGKWFAEEIGFKGSELTLLSTLISELARKVLSLNNRGRVVIRSVQRGSQKGIAINVSENLMIPHGISADHRRSESRDRQSDERLLMLAEKHVTDEFEVRPKGQIGSVVKVVKWL